MKVECPVPANDWLGKGTDRCNCTCHLRLAYAAAVPEAPMWPAASTSRLYCSAAASTCRWIDSRLASTSRNSAGVVHPGRRMILRRVAESSKLDMLL